jgi:uncharacterized RDD family membrane protein YckC
MVGEAFVPSTWRRFFAYWVDRMIIGFCYAPAFFQAVGSYFRDQIVQVDLRWLILGWLFALIYDLCFVYFMGGSVGKLLFHLRVISVNGKLTFWQVLLRTLTNELNLFFGLAHRALALLRLDRTHLADWVAETRVVQLEPRSSPPVRRKILGPILVLVIALSSFSNLYRKLQQVHFEGSSLIFDTNR